MVSPFSCLIVQTKILGEKDSSIRFNSFLTRFNSNHKILTTLRSVLLYILCEIFQNKCFSNDNVFNSSCLINVNCKASDINIK